MATKKKMLQAAAGSAGSAGVLDITDVFSTYLYVGAGAASNTGAAKTITNGIDLSNEGGLVWIKHRNSATNHSLVDSEVGVDYFKRSNTTAADTSFSANSLLPMVFNEDGFTTSDYGEQGYGGGDFASWTFRKAPKFFDVVTYTGDGTTDRQIAHSLGISPGVIIVKTTNVTDNWIVYHRGLTQQSFAGNIYTHSLALNATAAEAQTVSFRGNAQQTDSVFTLGYTGANTNESGKDYVAYLFAHNDGDGGFGPDGDADIIKCGSYAHAYAGTEVNLGFEPQWILFKAADQANNWYIFDAMRGIVTGGLSGDGDAALFPNTSGAENVNTWGVDLTATGFIAYGNNIASSGNIIYMAIRRGPLAPPEAGTEVFAPVAQNTTSTPLVTTGFPVDLAILTSRSGANRSVVDRLRGSTESSSKRMFTNDTGAETSSSGGLGFDNNTGYKELLGGYSDNILWNWKRAPGFFDVVAYTGNGTAGRTVSHNLGVAPEMMIVKRRASGASSWTTYVLALGATKYLRVNNTNAAATSSLFWNNTSPTDSVFTLGSDADVNGSSGETYIAYLFATLAGISKVGSYTGTGAAQNIDCGFTTGARFILLKNTSGTGNWYLFDSARGIVAGNDPYLYLNLTNAEVTSRDGVDPLSSGFTLTTDVTFNASGATYIFYAIA